MTLSSIKIRRYCAIRPRLALFLSCQNQKRRHQGDQRRGSRGQQQPPAMQVEICSGDHGYTYEQHVDDGKRDQEMPSQPHQLIETVPRQSEAQPHEQIDVGADLQQEPESTVNPGEKWLRRFPERWF